MRHQGRRIRITILLAAGLALPIGFTAPARAQKVETFPCPSEIEPLVSFWVEIFTLHDKNWTILHDEDDPGIRYETLHTEGMSESGRRELISDRRSHFSKVLEELALKPAARWEAEEKRVAALFPKGSGASRFLKAAGSIRSQRGIRDQFVDGLVRSGRWKPTVEAILASYGMPTELAALPHVESSYNPAALSKAGAAGAWQFTTGTGRKYLRIDRYVDERRDIYIATHAAARYLKEAYEKLGSWPLAVTSYNHGVDGMMRARRELGSPDIVRLIREYDGPYFGFASKNFYAEFLAAIRVTKDHELYFGNLQLDPPEEVQRFVLPGPARFSSLAKAFGTPSVEMIQLNPALTSDVLREKVSLPAGIVLNVPAGRVSDPAAAYASLPDADRRAWGEPTRYKVRAGDTLGSIARKHGVSVAELQKENELGRSTRIRTGQRLRIPVTPR
ncbi:MAG: transglycosylase SLT domain-containing protein [Candidatus Eisenbacteria bacterium]|nr:transglycosylase SLT domain-containing protein [Candidatus Eisenbacteria bacterium]